MTDDTTPEPSAVLALARELSDAVARFYRACEDSVNDIEPAREHMFAVQVRLDALLIPAHPDDLLAVVRDAVGRYLPLIGRRGPYEIVRTSTTEVTARCTGSPARSGMHGAFSAAAHDLRERATPAYDVKEVVSHDVPADWDPQVAGLIVSYATDQSGEDD